MRCIQVLSLLFTICLLHGQSPWGLEYRYSENETKNRDIFFISDVNGTSSFHEYIGQRPLWTKSHSVGLCYHLSRRHIIKLHMGKHESGQIVDIRSFTDDFGGPYISYDRKNKFKSYQANPSFTFALFYKKLSFPIELGVNINKLHNRSNIFIGYPKIFMFDARLAAGLGVQIDHNFTLSANVVVMRAIADYLRPSRTHVSYLPQIIGAETRVAYRF